ncbi:hypothetical protein CNEO4_950076 [Clostridium neonatale]|nr:hypothetical protein CNEO4_420026 [Clostridium neonatale]CAI3729157.1 hypothetical protein CNEO4_950076 [Clostridium neonatale]
MKGLVAIYYESFILKNHFKGFICSFFKRKENDNEKYNSAIEK